MFFKIVIGFQNCIYIFIKCGVLKINFYDIIYIRSDDKKKYVVCDKKDVFFMSSSCWNRVLW